MLFDFRLIIINSWENFLRISDAALRIACRLRLILHYFNKANREADYYALRNVSLNVCTGYIQKQKLNHFMIQTFRISQQL